MASESAVRIVKQPRPAARSLYQGPSLCCDECLVTGGCGGRGHRPCRFGHDRVSCWRAIPEQAVGAELVKGEAPVLDEHGGFPQGVEDFPIQAPLPFSAEIAPMGRTAVFSWTPEGWCHTKTERGTVSRAAGVSMETHMPHPPFAQTRLESWRTYTKRLGDDDARAAAVASAINVCAAFTGRRVEAATYGNAVRVMALEHVSFEQAWPGFGDGASVMRRIAR